MSPGQNPEQPVVDISTLRAAHQANGGPTILGPSRVTGPRSPIMFRLIPQPPLYLLMACEPTNPDAGTLIAAGPIDAMPMLERIMADARAYLTGKAGTPE